VLAGHKIPRPAVKITTGSGIKVRQADINQKGHWRNAGGSLVGLYSLHFAPDNPRLERKADLEPAIAIVLDARIRDVHKPHMLVAGTNVGNINTELFQAAFQWFDSKILVRHEVSPFLKVGLIDSQLVVCIVA
jgi:hypothetical protein